MPLTHIRDTLDRMESSAMLRRNMGEYGTADRLHEWYRKLRSAVIADEKEIDAKQKDERSRVP
jgi:hypothetical protein